MRSTCTAAAWARRKISSASRCISRCSRSSSRGPIVRYADIETQLGARSHTLAGAAVGVRRFILGLSKKVLLANLLGELVAAFKASGEKSVLYVWLYAVAYALQVYFDFSGYSDMAIGLGRIFGFRFAENFDHPYVSGSVTEFWRRWHISLGTCSATTCTSRSAGTASAARAGS